MSGAGWRSRRSRMAQGSLRVRGEVWPGARKSVVPDADGAKCGRFAQGPHLPKPGRYGAPGFVQAPGRRGSAGLIFVWLTVAVLLLGMCAQGFGQQAGGLAGTVVDVSGAVIPGAVVTVRPALGGVASSATSDGAGEFQISGLAMGDFVVTVTATGFATMEQKVTVGAQAVTLPVTLSIAQASETIAVNANTAAIETTETGTGGTLDAREMETVPLNGRSFTDALAVQPGVTPSSAAQPNAIVMSGVASTPP